jgi:hypothetical protein
MRGITRSWRALARRENGIANKKGVQNLIKFTADMHHPALLDLNRFPVVLRAVHSRGGC